MSASNRTQLFRTLFCLLLAAVLGHDAARGQTSTINGYNYVLGQWDASQAARTNNSRTGTGSPVGRDSCLRIGESYFQTDAATSGQNVWYCTAVGNPGTWANGNSGGTGSVNSVQCNSSFAPSWLTCSFGASPSTLPVLQLTPATGLSPNLVLATPNGASGAFSPRALVAPDIPPLPYIATLTAGSGLSGGGSSSSVTVNCLTSTTTQIGCAEPDNSTIKATSGVYATQSTTVNGATCTPGSSCNANYVSGSVTSGHLATFSGTSGEIQDGGAIPSGGSLITTGTTASLPGSCSTAGNVYKATDSLYEWICNGSTYAPFVYGYAVTMPLASNFSWVNQGTSPAASVDGTYGGLYLVAPHQSGGVNLRIQEVAAPGSTPFTYTALIATMTLATNYTAAGIGFRESSTGKLAVIDLTGYGTPQVELEVASYNSPTSFNTSVFSLDFFSSFQTIWLRVKDDGTNMISSFSIDGAHWEVVNTTVLTTFFTTGPNEAFFFADSENATYDAAIQLWSWAQN